jgi:acyl-CoA synthetase (AMP-forming)/AMP-acid ligase II
MFRASPITDTLIKKALEAPDEQVLLTGQHQITNLDIYNGALSLAQHLQQKGFQPGDRAVIAAQPGFDFVKVIYALIFLRGQIAIIDPEMGRDNYKSKLRQFDPQWAFVDSRLLLLQEHPILRWLYLRKSATAPYFPRTKGIKIIACGYWLPLVQTLVWLPRKPLPCPAPETLLSTSGTASHANDEFLITYTSGTIAEPKGVVHTVGSISESVRLIGQLLNPEKETLMAAYLPHYILIAMSAGLKALVYDPKKMDAVEKLAFLAQNGVTTIMGPPADFLPMIEHCEQSGTTFPSGLQHIMLGSAPVTRRFLTRIAAVCHPELQITCLYGMTENLLTAYTDGRFKRDFDTPGDLLGTLAPDVEAKIVDDEIFIKSPQLFRRYFHLSSRDEWHPTGDLGQIDESGQLILLGRKKDMIIRRNQNIYPTLYESTINQIPEVDEAVLVGIYDEARADEQVVLFVEGKENLDKYTLMKRLEAGPFAIDAEALPDEIILMKLPRSGRQHKVDKQALRALGGRTLVRQNVTD